MRKKVIFPKSSITTICVSKKLQVCNRRTLLILNIYIQNIFHYMPLNISFMVLPFFLFFKVPQYVNQKKNVNYKRVFFGKILQNSQTTTIIVHRVIDNVHFVVANC